MLIFYIHRFILEVNFKSLAKMEEFVDKKEVGQLELVIVMI